MSDLPDLDRLVEEATFFPGLNVRLSAVRELARISEEQLDLARRLAIARMRLEHSQRGRELHAEDRRVDLESLEQEVTHLVPKLTRGGLLLSVWSIFERSVKDIAFKAASHVGRPLHRSYFRSGSLLVTLEQALQTVVRTPVFPEKDQRSSLELLAAVRNLLVHHDGRREEAPPVIARLTRGELEVVGLQIERDYDFEYLVPGAELAANSASLVYTYVHALASRVFNELVPPPAPEV